VRIILIAVILLTGCTIQVGSPNLPAIQLTAPVQVGATSGPMVNVDPVITINGRLFVPDTKGGK
jgi:hypothetical protein